MNAYYNSRNLEELIRKSIPEIIAPSSEIYDSSYYLKEFSHLPELELKLALIESIKREIRYDSVRTRETLEQLRPYFFKTDAGKRIYQKIYNNPDNLKKVLFVEDGSFYKHKFYIFKNDLYIRIFDKKATLIKMDDNYVKILEIFEELLKQYDQIIIQI